MGGLPALTRTDPLARAHAAAGANLPNRRLAARRVFPPARAETGPLLALEDLAGDKLAALFSRAAARDFVDVHALSERFSREELYELARDKDTGFVLGRLHDSLGTFEHRYRQDFPVSDEEYERLRAWVHEWRAELPTPEDDVQPQDPPLHAT